MQIVILIVIFIVISMAERIFGGSLSRTIQEKKDKVTAGMIWKSILMLGISIAALVGFIYVGVEKLSKTEMGGICSLFIIHTSICDHVLLF